VKIKDGEPITIWLKNGKGSAIISCCDCNLVHRFEFEAKRSLIRMRAWRDMGLTEELRELKAEKGSK